MMNKEDLYNECRRLHPTYKPEQVEAWVQYTLNTHPAIKTSTRHLDLGAVLEVGWRVAIFLLLLVIAAPKAHCQQSQIENIQFQNSSGTLIKTYAGPFAVRCGNNLICTVTGRVIRFDVSGVLTAVTADAPLSGSGTSASHLTIPAATSLVDGYLKKEDWTTFNSKQATLTTGNLTASAPLAFDNTRQVIGGAATVSIPAATSLVDGYLTHTDWSTFNGKQAALGFTPANSSITISTTAPITGGGDLSANRTFAIPAATAAVNGYLTSTDFTTFNGKQAALGFTPANSTITISTTAPITGGGDLTTNRTFAMAKATASVDGYLASADFATFLTNATVRTKLTGNVTYYVRTDGSDSNTGLANTAGGAFLTIQKAVDVACAFDLQQYTFTIQVADGTYTGTVRMYSSPPVSSVGTTAGNIVIQGNSSTPANVVVSVTGSNAFEIVGNKDVALTIKDLKITTVTSGNAIYAARGIVYISGVNFGAVAAGNSHIVIDTWELFAAIGNYTISGSAQYHVYCTGFSYFSVSSKTVTLTGTPAWSTAGFYAAYFGFIFVPGDTFSGSATGKRYISDRLSLIDTNGGGASYLPGNVAGTTSNSGLYL
jgi:hypothetical protein